jgi:hypothetical protein
MNHGTTSVEVSRAYHLGDPRLWKVVRPCVLGCGRSIGVSQFQSKHGLTYTVYPGCVCDVCYDATYPTPQTSAKSRREGAT